MKTKPIINLSFNYSFIFVIIFFFLFLLRLYTKTFYDDELGTILVINQNLNIFSLYRYVNTWDVSPPLSYMLVFIGSKLLSYQFAPLIFFPIQIYCLLKFTKEASNFFKFDKKTTILFSITSIFNPTFLLWCTSLRWYSLWFPLAFLAISIFYFVSVKKDKHILILLLVFSIMFHLNYLTILFVFSLLLSNINFFLNDFIKYVKKNYLIVILIIIANFPQFFFLISYHMDNSSNQFGSYTLSFLFPLVTIIFGNSVFPLEVISIIFLLILTTVVFINIKKINVKKIYPYRKIIIFFFTFLIALFITKLGFKARHSLILYYLFLIFIFVNFNLIKNKIIIFLFSIILVSFNMYGLKNTIMQTNTIKNNINFPVKKIINFINQNSTSCKDVNVFTHNIKLKYYLSMMNIKNYYINDSFSQSNMLKKNNCTFIIKSYFANNDSEEINKINQMFDNYKKKFSSKSIRYDKFDNIKNKLYLKNSDNGFVVKILH
jgi:hypothetical protein